MITHNLKIKECYWNRVRTDIKKAEVRFNDRDFQTNDIIKFIVVDDLNIIIKKPDEEYIITHIHSGLGLKENYVMLSIEKKGDENETRNDDD